MAKKRKKLSAQEKFDRAFAKTARKQIEQTDRARALSSRQTKTLTEKITIRAKKIRKKNRRQK